MRLAEAHSDALGETRRRVAAVTSDQLELSTPCEDWSVRELLNHIVAGNLWAAELAAGKAIDEVGDRLDGDVLDDDLLSAYEQSAKLASDVFAEPGAMEAMCAVSYGPVPGSVYCGHRVLDVVIHGWDLATATGQDDVIPAALVQVCQEILEPQLEALQASGAFGEEVEVGSDADPQARLLALLGRSG
ncbi:MAG: hypothetical protein JJLCMIEE_02429 [Acidimicrobiales bacterium]|nr:hypothetical protein [Acidimicrobiales bacterium]